MRTVGFIPSRLNSQRVPGKNVKLLAGIPLVNYVLAAANKVEELDEVVIFSSDPGIAGFIRSGLKYKLVTRPDWLDTQQARVQDLIGEFLKVDAADVIAMLHITSPFLKPETISDCVSQVKSGRYDSAFAAGAVTQSCWFAGKPLNNRRPDSTEPVLVEQSFYVFKRSVFEGTGRRIADRPYIKIIDDREGQDIDTFEDLRIAEMLMAKRAEAQDGQ